MEPNPISSLAIPRPGGYRIYRLRNGKRTVWRKVVKRHGFTVHFSGSDLFKGGGNPDENGLRIYGRERANLGQYLGFRDGRIIQMVPDNLVCAHAGVEPWQYQAYRDGSWRGARISDEAMRLYLIDVAKAEKAKLPIPKLWPNPSPQALALWDERWKKYGFQHPGQIGPSISNNDDYAAIELVVDEKHPVTKEQLESLRRLLWDFATRWGLGLRLWTEPGRLVGHSDLDAYERWTKRGPWDPDAAFPWGMLGPPDEMKDLLKLKSLMKVF